jgi:hypothetical protein
MKWDDESACFDTVLDPDMQRYQDLDDRYNVNDLYAVGDES